MGESRFYKGDNVETGTEVRVYFRSYNPGDRHIRGSSFYNGDLARGRHSVEFIF